MASDMRLYKVDKFFGINQESDSKTELKTGEASEMMNFTVTDGYNLKLRPGIRRVNRESSMTARVYGSWAGKVSGEDVAAVYYRDRERFDYLAVYKPTENGFDMVLTQGVRRAEAQEGDAIVKFFTFGEQLWCMTSGKIYTYDPENGFTERQPYIPRVVIGASPSGGGTTLEAINLLSNYRRVDYNADGAATSYLLPEKAYAVTQIIVDNVTYPNSSALGTYDQDTQTFTFIEAPQKGVGNVEITYLMQPDSDMDQGRAQIVRCKLAECYNGSADTRLFVAGNGTNVCYYSGVTDAGAPDPTYFPAMNEVRVNMDSSEVTGMKRHYTKLVAFTREGAYTITYEPVTLTDGSTIAGFYLRSANSGFGNEAVGQVQIVDNYPRTITDGGIYEWKITSSFYRDERNAQLISQRVERSLKAADPKKIVTCDDGYRKEYWVFLNDEEGTILVHRYGLGKDGVWVIYKCGICANVTTADMCGNRMFITTAPDEEGWSGMYWFDDEALMDDGKTWRDEATGIPALWESGFMDFGADFRRKYSSILYVSMLPEENSELIVTAETDKRSDYLEKAVAYEEPTSPKIKRIRLKVKKFVYYKLILRVNPGKRATVLGIDQQVRFASMAK
jgi:hypothetical protein